jgi:hypothetical protein
MSVVASSISSIDANARFHRHIWDNWSLLFSYLLFSLQYRRSAEYFIVSLQTVHLKLLKVV